MAWKNDEHDDHHLGDEEETHNMKDENASRRNGMNHIYWMKGLQFIMMKMIMLLLLYCNLYCFWSKQFRFSSPWWCSVLSVSFHQERRVWMILMKMEILLLGSRPLPLASFRVLELKQYAMMMILNIVTTVCDIIKLKGITDITAGNEGDQVLKIEFKSVIKSDDQNQT